MGGSGAHVICCVCGVAYYSPCIENNRLFCLVELVSQYSFDLFFFRCVTHCPNEFVANRNGYVRILVVCSVYVVLCVEAIPCVPFYVVAYVFLEAMTDQIFVKGVVPSSDGGDFSVPVMFY